MITVDSAPADNHERTLGTGTNGLGNDTRVHCAIAIIGAHINRVKSTH